MNMFNIYHCFPLSRLLLGSGLLWLAVCAQFWGISIMLLLLSVALVYILDGHGLTIIRLLRLLRWFVVPIILLHALFTPGQLLWPEFFILISREGLVHGLKLSLHLSAIFFVAMLMFRLLKRAEWLRYLLGLPYIGERIVIYVWMMSCMKMNNSTLFGDLRLQFRLRKDMKWFPSLLISAFRQSLHDASEHACALWLRWPASPVAMQQRAPAVQYYVASLLLVCAGFTAFLWPWL